MDFKSSGVAMLLQAFLAVYVTQETINFCSEFPNPRNTTYTFCAKSYIQQYIQVVVV